MLKRKALLIILLVIFGGGLYAVNHPDAAPQNSEAEKSAVNTLVAQLANTSVIKDLQVTALAADSGSLKAVQASTLTIDTKATIAEVAAGKLSSESVVTNSVQSGSLVVRGSTTLYGSITTSGSLITPTIAARFSA